jgi:RNA polymerase sigma factor (sigma-70 family)
MTGVRLGTALRHIEWLFSAGSATGSRDTQLLGRFARNRDEASFAALIARHGPMVMTVCRGVLRDSLEAEDAFQATFLVLARKAGSVWAEGGLGGWLHRVAYRIAVRASLDAARRRTHERHAAEVAAVQISQVDSDDDLQPALYEELARLPTKLRVPVVLCYLEGLTHAQAALQLKCGEATVRRRLAGARERLRNRLVRRGFAPAGSAFILSVASEARAVPSAVADATLRAAVRVASGEAVAAVAGERLAGLTALTEGWKTAAYLALAVVVAGAGALIGVFGAQIPGGSNKARVERFAQFHARAEPRPRASSTGKHAITGMVLAPDGKPLPGADVFWIAYPRVEPAVNAMPKEFKVKPEDFRSKLAHAATDSAGRFELTAAFDAHAFPVQEVVVKTSGAGISRRTVFGKLVGEGAGDNEQLRFRLRKAVTIEGRLLTVSGAPANGVKISLESVQDGKNELESDGISLGRFGEDDAFRPEYWPERWTTDNEGRFRIEGLVPEKMFAELKFSHPDFADDDLFVSTGGTVDGWARDLNLHPVDARFVHTLARARPVTGIVSDKETGQPLAGVLVEMIPLTMRGMMPVRTTTDASGRYRAAGSSSEFFQVTAFPDPGSGYLPVQMHNNQWPVGAKTLNVDLALAKGQVVRGRVVEGKNGQPVAGASVVYQPGPNNSADDNGDYDFRNPVLTDKSGSFALTALPGPGLVAAEVPSSDFIRVAVTGPGTNRPSNARPHGFTWIDVPVEKNKEITDVRVTLRKGVTLEARIVGPDNLPVDVASGFCAEFVESQFAGSAFPRAILDGQFQLEGADPDRNYRVFFIHPKHKLGAVAELKYDPKVPAVVQLQPTATARGTMLDEKARLLEGTQVLAWIDLTKGDRELTEPDFDDDSSAATLYSMLTGEPVLQSYPAEFKFDKLIPGVRFYFLAGGTYHAIPALKPGEVRDLGRIVVKPPKEGD